MHRKIALKILLLIFAIAILVLFPTTALLGASDGIELCIKTLIPSLFPFMVLSSALLNILRNVRIPMLTHLCKICKMPSGCDSILFTGLLGGYPVGAKLIAESFASGNINKKDAARLLGFCNNAGPAFIFGILGSAFSSFGIAFVVWLIHIMSAIITGALLPQVSNNQLIISHKGSQASGTIIERCVSVMGIICGWVILFRIIIAYMEAILPAGLSNEFYVLASGILELSNGCIQLSKINDPATRFLICNCLLAFGGGCVALQTAAIAQNVGLSYYLPGKIIQTFISITLTLITQNLLFINRIPSAICICLVSLSIPAAIMSIYILRQQNNSSI